MKKCGFIIVLLIFVSIRIQGQVSFLDNPNILEEVKYCLSSTHNFSFQEASRVQKELSTTYPEHPAPDFLKALIIYWENFPLTPDKDISADFIDFMDRSIHKAEAYIDNEQLYIEGLFFDLFGRAFKTMFWADNGKITKIIPDLRRMYTHTIEGFELKDNFNEFYFSSGLYNYYIEAYVETHPIYKPLVSFMKEGDKELGLTEMQYAIEVTNYLKAEALLFMFLLQINYEQNLNKAVIYAKKLHLSYPDNIYYLSRYIIVLFYLEKYQESDRMINKIERCDNSFSRMIGSLGRAFIEEHSGGNLNDAITLYKKSLEISDDFGEFGDLYKAIAYMGLFRISEKQGNEKTSRKYLRKAKDHTNYQYIITGN